VNADAEFPSPVLRVLEVGGAHGSVEDDEVHDASCGGGEQGASAVWNDTAPLSSAAGGAEWPLGRHPLHALRQMEWEHEDRNKENHHHQSTKLLYGK